MIYVLQHPADPEFFWDAGEGVWNDTVCSTFDSEVSACLVGREGNIIPLPEGWQALGDGAINLGGMGFVKEPETHDEDGGTNGTPLPGWRH